MFGRIRSSPSPAECLEFERPPSKIPKDDSLSIYEATLVKLKQGSQHSTKSQSPTSQDLMESELNSKSLEGSSECYELCTGLLDSSHHSSCIGISLSPNQDQRRGREISINYLFSKYAGSHPNQGSTCCNSGLSVNTSSCSSDSELTVCSRLKF